MKGLSTGLLAVFLTSVSIGHAADDPLDPLLASLQAIAKNDADKNTPSPSTGVPANGEPVRFSPALLSFTTVIRQSVAQGNFDNAINSAGQLTSVDPSDEFQKQAAALIALLQKMHDDQDAQFGARVDRALDDATRAILTAKTPKEIDAPLAELYAVRDLANSNGYWNQRRQGLSQKLQGAANYVKWWQDYLQHLASGRNDQARDSLRNIANNEFSFSPIPRSELLQRAEAPPGIKAVATDSAPLAKKELDAILSQIKGLADIPAAVIALRAFQQAYHDDSLNQTIDDLASVGRAKREFDLGRYSVTLQQLHLNSLNSGPLDLVVRSLQREMVLAVVAKTLGVPDAPSAKADEVVADYLLRVAGEYRKAARWGDLRRVLSVYSDVVYYNSGKPEWLSADLEAIKAYQVGQVQEKAGQPVDAIRSYRRSLSILGSYFPSSVPGDALKALQKSAPDAYDAVMKASGST